MRSLHLSLLATFLVLTAAGCASSKEGEDRTPRRIREMDDGSFRTRVALAESAVFVRTVQLYRGNDERQLPIIPLRSRERLTLEFDLVEESSRPLSVYFYHADRQWRRDLTPGEYLRTFQRGDILDYSMSRATEVEYVHYRYSFPSEEISFTLSGNYILRVTEQGMEEDVLFERAFFVSEQSADLEMGFDSYQLAGQGFPSITPVALFVPPRNIQANVFDYSVCFVLNGQLGAARCSSDPSLMQQPALQFYLQPSSSFEPVSADYFLDLSALQIGNRIERTDLAVSPFEVFLEPDYARFGGAGIDPLLNGQTVVSGAVTSVAEPRTAAEYVRTHFSFVPPNERRVRGEIYIVGSFNSWSPSAESRLRWVAERGRYEGTLLIKQGRHEYRYHATDAGTRESIDRGIPRAQNLYTAFVYYNDIRVNTDRLLAVNTLIRP